MQELRDSNKSERWPAQQASGADSHFSNCSSFWRSLPGIAALVMPQLSNAIALFELKSGARQLASALQAARGRAIARDGEVALIVDVQKRTYRTPASAEFDRCRRISSLTLETADREVLNEQMGAIRFFPDGSSTGGRLTLAARGRRYVVSVNWLTGRVTTHE